MTKAKLSSTSFLIFAVAFGSGFLVSQESAKAQFRVVSPSEIANAEAPDVADLANFPSYRFQQVYSAEDFASLGPGSFQISRIDWRPDGELTEPLTYSTPSWLLRLSTTQREPADLSATFADNIGPDEKVVVDGAVTMSTDNLGPVGGPKSFDYGIEFDSPFTFDPTAGNLLMDLTVVDATGPLLLDFSFAPTETTSFHWTGTLGHESPVAATTPEAVGGPFGGHAIQFTMVPEPHANRSPFFWDEFDRSDLFDSDISYIRDDTPEEEYEIVDGSLIVNSLADDYPAVRVDVPDGMDDFIIKTQGRILNNENCQWAWLGMYGRAVESATSDTFDSQNGNYWAGYSTQGQIHIGETSAEPATTIHNQKQEYSCREATENDVHMEFRVLGSDLEFTTWLDGSPRPEEPNLTWTDNTWTENDFAGVFINPDHLEDFALRYLAILPAIDGDFDASGVLDATDLDLLSAEVRSERHNRALDLNGDAIVNDADRLALIHDLLDTWSGDSNLDGEFNSSDLVEVFQAGQYEDAIVGNSTWATGDWNGDAEFDSADFVVAFQEGGFEMGPRVASHVVPEPTLGLLGQGLMLLASSSRVVRNRR